MVVLQHTIRYPIAPPQPTLMAPLEETAPIASNFADGLPPWHSRCSGRHRLYTVGDDNNQTQQTRGQNNVSLFRATWRAQSIALYATSVGFYELTGEKKRLDDCFIGAAFPFSYR